MVDWSGGSLNSFLLRNPANEDWPITVPTRPERKIPGSLSGLVFEKGLFRSVHSPPFSLRIAPLFATRAARNAAEVLTRTFAARSRRPILRLYGSPEQIHRLDRFRERFRELLRQKDSDRQLFLSANWPDGLIVRMLSQIKLGIRADARIQTPKKTPQRP